MMIQKKWVTGVVLACGLMLLASVALADKAAIEKKARETVVTVDLKEVSADKALDVISLLSGVAIRKTDVPKESQKVSASFKNVSVLDCLKVVTGMAGFSYVIVEDGIEVSCKKK